MDGPLCATEPVPRFAMSPPGAGLGVHVDRTMLERWTVDQAQITEGR